MEDNKKDRFYLKTFSVVFETTSFDMDDEEGQIEICKKVTNEFKNWFDLIDSNFEILQSGEDHNLDEIKPKILEDKNNLNILILLTLVIKIDSNYVDYETASTDFKLLGDNVTNALKEFLDNRELDYRIIKQK